MHGKKVLVFGLGSHGGGIATTKWLLMRGASVRVTDRKTRDELSDSLQILGKHPKLSFSLGGHQEKDITWADLVIVNPGVPREHPLLHLAAKLRKPLWNDAALFFTYTKRPSIGITGTRGKTTVTNWVASLLSRPKQTVLAAGNTPENPLLKEIIRRVTSEIPAVLELSSWQLEFLPASERAPRVAVITNLYPDHLNRYEGITAYADAKANIFLHQKKNDVLILNADDLFTPYFLSKHPNAVVRFVSDARLPKGKDGVCVVGGQAVEIRSGMKIALVPIRRFQQAFGEHNLMNLLMALAAVRALDPHRTWKEKDILALKTPPLRQEIVERSRRMIVVNDSAATSPDGVIAAIRRFQKVGKVVLITGGTDKELPFGELARVIRSSIPSPRLVLLDGSATKKLALSLEKLRYPKGIWSIPKDSLEECVLEAQNIAKGTKEKVVILFSPGAASFEKFKDEFDRGAQFSKFFKKRMPDRTM